MAYIVCTSNLDLVSFLFVPALYSTLLFTNKLSERLCHNPYLFTKFYTSKHLGKRVGQTCMFTLVFLLWCENGIVYKQVIRTFVSYH